MNVKIWNEHLLVGLNNSGSRYARLETKKHLSFTFIFRGFTRATIATDYKPESKPVICGTGRGTDLKVANKMPEPNSYCHLLGMPTRIQRWSESRCCKIWGTDIMSPARPTVREEIQVITNDFSDYLNLLVRISHIIHNHPIQFEW